MPIRQGGKDAMSSASLARGTLGRSSTGLAATEAVVVSRSNVRPYHPETCWRIVRFNFCSYN